MSLAAALTPTEGEQRQCIDPHGSGVRKTSELFYLSRESAVGEHRPGITVIACLENCSELESVGA